MTESTIMVSSLLMRGLDDNEMKLFKDCFKEQSFSSGDYLFKEDEEGDALFIVESGIVELKRWIMQGDIEKLLLRAEEGCVFGEMAFMDRGGRAATAFAIDDVKVQTLTRSDFDAFNEKNPLTGAKVLDNLLCIVVDRLRTTNKLYLDTVQHELQTSGGQQLNFQRLIAKSMIIKIELSSGNIVTGSIIQVEKSDAGYEVIIRDSDGNLIMVPYHSVAMISFDLDSI